MGSGHGSGEVVGLERLLVVMGVVRAWESRNYRDTAGVAGIQREAVEGKGLERGTDGGMCSYVHVDIPGGYSLDMQPRSEDPWPLTE